MLDLERIHEAEAVRADHLVHVEEGALAVHFIVMAVPLELKLLIRAIRLHNKSHGFRALLLFTFLVRIIKFLDVNIFLVEGTVFIRYQHLMEHQTKSVLRKALTHLGIDRVSEV